MESSDHERGPEGRGTGKERTNRWREEGSGVCRERRKPRGTALRGSEDRGKQRGRGIDEGETEQELCTDKRRRIEGEKLAAAWLQLFCTINEVQYLI